MTSDNAKRAEQLAVACESAVNAVLLAMVLAQAEREKMDAMDRELLARVEYYPAPEFVAHGRPRVRITEPRDAWMLSDVDSADYFADRQERIDALGYNLPRGHCPACCAESVQRDAEHVLIECAEPFFPGVTLHRLLCSGLDKRQKYIDLLIGLVVNRPGYRKPELQRA